MRVENSDSSQSLVILEPVYQRLQIGLRAAFQLGLGWPLLTLRQFERMEFDIIPERLHLRSGLVSGENK
jgi:hypothetical protein